MRKSNVQLQNHDRSHNRWIGPRELATMQEKGDVVVFMKGKGAKVKVVARLTLPVEALRSMNEASAPSITMSDMLASLGLNGKKNSILPVSHGRQAQAREKISAFTPTIRCNWHGELVGA